MFSFLKKLFFPTRSSFVINKVDHLRKVVILEDRQLSLQVEIPFDNKTLKEAVIVEPYALLLKYADGSEQKKLILE
jgi:hypothetical protein